MTLAFILATSLVSKPDLSQQVRGHAA